MILLLILYLPILPCQMRQQEELRWQVLADYTGVTLVRLLAQATTTLQFLQTILLVITLVRFQTLRLTRVVVAQH